MVFKEIVDDKMLYMDLLLLADEQEDMIHRYLEKGTMYVLDDNGVKAECIFSTRRRPTMPSMFRPMDALQATRQQKNLSGRETLQYSKECRCRRCLPVI